MAIRFEAPASFDLALGGDTVPTDPYTRLMMQVIQDLWFTNRSLVTDDFDRALEYLGRVLPMTVHEIPSGTEAWSWIVPKKWIVREAWLKRGERTICNFKDHPLHLVSYSPPFSGEVAREQLEGHLHYNADRPDAIPYVYKYYKPDWGFCIPYNVYRTLDGGPYTVHIDTALEDGALKVGEVVLPGRSLDSVVLSAHLCHPGQANDGLSGVAVGLAVLKRLSEMESRRLTYRLVLCPENIGSLCYLFKNQDLIPRLKHGVFLEMLGNKNHIKLQRSKDGDAIVDQLAEYAMENRVPVYGVGAFRKIVCNDEVNFNGPGVDVPTVSITRWHYPEYHTSDDTPSIISPRYLKESFDVVCDLVDLLERNVHPRRRYTGNVFLSRYDLYEDLNVDDTVERILLHLNGDLSVFEIARKLGISFDRAYGYVTRFQEAGLVTLAESGDGA